MSHRPAHAYHPSAELDLESHADEMRDAVNEAAAFSADELAASAALNLTGGSSSSLFSPPSSLRRGSMAVGYEDVAAQEIDYSPDFASPASAAAASTPLKGAGTPWLQPTPAAARRPNGTPHSAVRIRALSVEADPKSVVPLAALPTAAAPAAASTNEPRFGSVGVYAALIGAQLCWSGFHLFAKVAFDYMHPVSHCDATQRSRSCLVSLLLTLCSATLVPLCCSDGDAHAACPGNRSNHGLDLLQSGS